MKKVVVLSVMLSMLFSFSFVADVNAQSDKKYNKEMEKVYKKKTKELKKEKWQVSGTSLTLEASLMKHLRALQSADNTEMTAEVSMCKSANVCKMQAFNNVLVEYAQRAGSYIRGRVASDMSNNASAEVPEEFDNFYAAYERLVASEIKGEIEFSFALEKKNGSGKTYRAYYLLNEEKSGKARLRAMQKALEETKLKQQYAEQVSSFVKEGFKMETDAE